MSALHTFGAGPSTGMVVTDPADMLELARFYRPAPHTERAEVTDPDAAARLFAPHFYGLDREACIALHLDTKHRLIGTSTVSVGSIEHTFMSAREVFRDALLANARATLLAHNHPSGDPEPSRDDEQVTRRLSRAGEMIGVDLLDHMVFGGDAWVSLARRGVL